MEFAKIFLGGAKITTELKSIECEEWVYADT